MKDLTLGKIGGWLIGLIALGATSSRTIHFLNSILPASEHYLSWLTVAILDFGLLFWLSIYLTGSKGKSQHAISLAMIILSGIGIAATTAGDLFLMFENQAAKDSSWGLLALCSVLILLLANVAAKVAMSIANPVHQKAAAESELEEGIDDEEINQLRQAIPTVAKRLANAKVTARLAAIEQATLASLPSGTYTQSYPVIEQHQEQPQVAAPGGPTTKPANNGFSLFDIPGLKDMLENFTNQQQREQAAQPRHAQAAAATYAADSGSDHIEPAQPKNA